MLRDAGEAQRLRVEALERELEDARREIEPLRARAARADVAEVKASRLEKELASLRAELAPERKQTARRGVLVLVAGLGVIAAIASAAASLQIAQAERETASTRERADLELDAMRASHAREVESLQDQLSASRERAERAEARAASIDQELEGERRREQLLRSRHSFVALDLSSRDVRIAGRDDLPRDCQVALSPADGECRARVSCGGVEIYPSPGRGGYFSCEVAEEHLVRGRDVNGTAASGDPMLDVEGAHGVITVADGPSPAWSVRITTQPL